MNDNDFKDLVATKIWAEKLLGSFNPSVVKLQKQIDIINEKKRKFNNTLERLMKDQPKANRDALKGLGQYLNKGKNTDDKTTI